MTILSLLRAILIVLCMDGVLLAFGIIAYLIFGIKNERDDNE